MDITRPIVAYLCRHVQCARMHLSAIHIELHKLFHLMAIGGKRILYVHIGIEQLWKYVCVYVNMVSDVYGMQQRQLPHRNLPLQRKSTI